MCLGAMIHARISRVVFGAYDQKTGVCGSCMDLSTSECFNHSIEISGGILTTQCKDLLQQFFKKRRN
jgi:tRNA(adenine34) deaminase